MSIRNSSLRVCLRLPAYSASAKVICFIGKLGRWDPGILPKSGSLFQSFPKPYSRLLKAIDAPREQQAGLLREFVEHWYAELARKGSDELWWYIYGDPVKHPLEKGSYFGRWCLEAVAAVKAFGLDDSQCLGHEHYPGDLLRPNGPSTHPVRPEPKRGWLSKLLGR
ncbi:TPA: DUF1911 domain-containing protein [Pseudomonas aeruginosa]|nr:DUF1911 domain-containing protein [Pseudomonas aeruginosa]PBX09384.1 hypothetical protein CJT86_26750 [Pseudomonas aeruginosa]HCF3038033.1 DUF1911 domain-containing protein [Pseudomonas aeruginosa]